MAGLRGGRRTTAATLATTLVLFALMSACMPSQGRGDGRPADSPAELTVFAAASLRDPMEAVAAAYEPGAGTRLAIATDSSTALRIQIEQGAHADVFLSADTTNPASLATSGLLDGEPVPFAGNQLTIVVPAGNPAGLASAADLGRPGIQIVAAGAGVPITAYAASLLAKLATLPGYPAGLPAAYDANIVTREDNVRAILARLELGEGDAGIVYASDAAGSKTVDTVAIPASAGVTATYAGGVLAGATDRAAARAFLDWLTGPDGQSVLGSFGFVRPP